MVRWRAAEALAPTDQLGVVSFNENAHWAVRTGPIDFGALGEGLDFGADGNTNIYAGLKAAYDDLVTNPASLRHIILITDGWSTSGAYDELLDDMKAAGITLSTIGTGYIDIAISDVQGPTRVLESTNEEVDRDCRSGCGRCGGRDGRDGRGRPRAPVGRPRGARSWPPAARPGKLPRRTTSEATANSICGT